MSYLPRNSAQVTSGNLLFAGQAPGWRVVSTPTEMGQQGGPRVSDGGFIDAEYQGWLPWQVGRPRMDILEGGQDPVGGSEVK